MKRVIQTPKRPGIALLITLFFVISVTAAVGVSIIQLRQSAQQVREGKCLIQSAMVLDDLLRLLKNSPVLDGIDNAEKLRYFLQNTAIIPIALERLNVKINIGSAMGRLNINTLASSKAFQENLTEYMMQYGIGDSEYFKDLLIDAMSGKKSEYRTDLFDAMPWLYREKIVSMAHFEQLLDYYVLTRHDNTIRNVPWQLLLRFGAYEDNKLDANYVTPQVWRLLLPDIPEEVAADLASGVVLYDRHTDLGLSAEDIERLKVFNLDYFVPRLAIDLDVSRNDQNVQIAFEYDMLNKKGGYFDYGL